MKRLILSFLLILGFITTGFAETETTKIATGSLTPMLISPATAHFIFKLCRRQAVYGCKLKGRVVVIAFNRANSKVQAPPVFSGTVYEAYWWPNHCIPPISMNDTSSCQFNLLLLPAKNQSFWG